MRPPRLKFSMGRMMIAVVVSAPIAIIGLKGYTAWRTTGHLLTAVLLTGLIGLLALRRPLVAIPFVMLTWFLTTAYAPGGLGLPSQGAMLAWCVSAPLGWGLRRGMRLPRSTRFTLKQMMIAVAVVALVLLVASNPDRHDGITDKRVVFPVASVVAAVYGLGAMRRPLMFLLPLLAVWIATPQVDHPTPDVINVSAGGCFLGWIIGAPAAWISRQLTSDGNSLPVALEPPESE